jgi:DUF4097 and DUF4098 domain-containing protein YvlB
MGTRFSVPPGTKLRVASASGRILVTAEDRDDIEVDPPERRVEVNAGERVAEVKSRSTNLHIRVPTGTDVSVGAISGSVTLEGTFGSVKVNAVSGQIQVENATGDVDVRSVSGNLSVGSAAGECCCNSKSGRINIGSVGRSAKAATISGTVELGTEGLEDVEIKTISGHVTINVPAGRRPRARFRTIAGKLRCEPEQGDDFEIRAASVSGSVDIKKS